KARLWTEFAGMVAHRKELEQEWRQRSDPDNDLKRALAPHLSPRNLRTTEIEKRIAAMNEFEWNELLRFVPPGQWGDYQRIRSELLGKSPSED
ncbi:MAG TPA: hypothetical protein VE242_10060, partial [Chthoniobacterales bacterium]|nr:hypothetical protein [Chthoniobacterales bacterium]